MIKKILIFYICTLLFFSIFHISVISSEINELKILVINSDPEEQTTNENQFLINPDFISTPPHPPIITKTVPYHPDIEISSTNDDIIKMLEEVNESLILRYLENLTSFGPKVTGTSECVNAAEYIYDEFQSMGLDVRYDYWENEYYSSNNIEATLKGTDNDSQGIFIVCGHYDTYYHPEPLGPGADDDGSGTITAMAIAYVMSKYSFKNTIRFVAFSGEEEGLFGSGAYANEAYLKGENIVGVLNADMIGFAPYPDDEKYLNIYENEASEWLYNFTYNVNELYNQYIQLIINHTGYSWGSDHKSFWDYGYDALFYQEHHFNIYYHSENDTIEHMNIPYTTKGVKLITATLAELVNISISDRPEIPNISGPTKFKPNQNKEFTFVTSDPDSDQIYYYVDWGDGYTSGWQGPYPSGYQLKLSHSWIEKAHFTIKCKAKDENHMVSEFGTYDISTPKNKTTFISIIERVWQNHPLIQKLLNRI